jgi:hypothetical protein
LFGSDVQGFLDRALEDLSAEATDRARYERPIPSERLDRLEAEHLARLNRLSNFSTDFDVLVAPYLKHHQKALSLWAWLAPPDDKGRTSP